MNVQELRKLEAAATPGPWLDRWPNGQGNTSWIIADDGHDYPIVVEGGFQYGVRRPADAALIAAARNALPLLLDLWEAAHEFECAVFGHFGVGQEPATVLHTRTRVRNALYSLAALEQQS